MSASCKTCKGTGLVAPGPFDPPEPWVDYVSRAAGLLELHPRSASLLLTGRLKPLPCPACGGPRPEPEPEPEPEPPERFALAG